jgi:hypothetical protein
MPTNTYDPTDPYHVNETLKEKDREIHALRTELAAALRGLAQLREAGIALLEANRMHAYSRPEASFALMSAEMAMRDALAATTTDE